MSQTRWITQTVCLVLLAGCTTYTPLEQLEAEALISGDWSLVEKREQRIARQKARRGDFCPDGSVAYCEISFGERSCQCVNAKALRSALVGY